VFRRILPTLFITLPAIFGIIAATGIIKEVAVIEPYLTLLVFGLSGLALLVSLYFNRGRLAFGFVAMILAIAPFYSPELRESLMLGRESLNLLYLTAGPLAMVLIVLFSFVKERGIITLWGILRLFMLGGAYGGLYYLARYHSGLWSELNFGIFVRWLEFTALGDLILITFILSLIVLGVKTVFFKSTVLEGVFWAFLLSTLSLFHFAGDTTAIHYVLLGASISMIIGLLAESYRLANFDELTALPNRRALFEYLHQQGRVYTVVMGDIDHFKKFNDTYGHDIGDDVLRLVADCLANVKGGGRAFRYGGEEFTLVFARKRPEEAAGAIEAVRSAIEKTPYDYRPEKGKPKTLSVTMSFGVSCSEGKKGDFEAIIKAADGALYKAKKAGRNRAVTA